MSAGDLRHHARVLIKERIEEHKTFLVEATHVPEAQVRIYQGIVQGLQMALEDIEEAHRKVIA